MNDFHIFLGIALIYIIIWILALYTVITKEFKSSNTKVVWALLLIFIPISCIVFAFMKDKLIVEEDVNKDKELVKGYLTAELITNDENEAYELIDLLQKLNCTNESAKRLMSLFPLKRRHVELNICWESHNSWHKYNRSYDDIEILSKSKPGAIIPKPIPSHKDEITRYHVVYLYGYKDNYF